MTKEDLYIIECADRRAPIRKMYTSYFQMKYLKENWVHSLKDATSFSREEALDHIRKFQAENKKEGKTTVFAYSIIKIRGIK